MSSCYTRARIGWGCDILAEVFITQRRKDAKRNSFLLCAFASLRLCVKNSWLFIAHGGVHGGNDGFGNSALLKFGDLRRGEIEVDWRLFDPFNDRSF